MNFSRPQHNASALLITLALLTLIVILVVGLLETVRISVISAATNLEGQRAEFYAEEGIQRVTATLRAATVPPSGGPTNNWISQPGLLQVATSSSSLPNYQIPLSTGTASSASINSSTSSLRPPNLNVPFFRDPSTFLITGGENTSGSAVEMRLKWLYVRKSGLIDPSETPVTTNASDPIVGRYAYWTDDESSKVNYNIAWGRGASNSNPISSPTRVNLAALSSFSSSIADDIHDYISSSADFNPLVHGFFNSPKDGWRVSPAVAAAMNTSYFDLTYYNNDPDLNMFGQPRIVLTTDVSRVPKKADGVTPAAPFIDVLTNPGANPGDYSQLSSTKVNTVMTNLIAQLRRTDWPMASGSSFEQKYYTGNLSRLAQLAINIIDYVRIKESTSTTCIPLRIEYTPASGTYAISGANGANCFLGTGREPCITEVGVWCPSTPIDSSHNTTFMAKFKIEVYLPKNYGIPSVDLTKYSYYVNTLYLSGGVSTDAKIGDLSIPTAITSGSNPLMAGNYAVITRTMTVTSTTPNVPPVTLNTRFSLLDGSPGGGRCVVVPQWNATTTSIVLTVDKPPIAEDNVHTMEVNDPRLGQDKDDWAACTSGNNTLGAQNSIYSVGKAAPAITPQMDTDASGHVSDASLFMPPPAGKIYNGYDNTAGIVTSVGELGFVHTGIEGATKAGISWRTLRIQPNNQASSVVPDWALLDLFTVPVNVPVTSTNIFQPHGSSVGGRVNVNAQLTPFATSWLPRTAPLTAVFQGAGNDSTVLSSTNSAATSQSIAQNIYNHTLASSGKDYGASSYYLTPGQITEIRGVSDNGEQSEENFRQAASLLTTRGNVFTVYSIGQAIKQTPTGQLTITGERRLQSMVERYSDLTTGTIRFRTVYYRTLSP